VIASGCCPGDGVRELGLNTIFDSHTITFTSISFCIPDDKAKAKSRQEGKRGIRKEMFPE